MRSITIFKNLTNAGNIKPILVALSVCLCFNSFCQKIASDVEYSDEKAPLEKLIYKAIPASFPDGIKADKYYFISLSIDKKGRIQESSITGFNDTVFLPALTDIFKHTTGKWKNNLKRAVIIGLPVLLEFDNEGHNKCKMNEISMRGFKSQKGKIEDMIILPPVKIVFFTSIN